MDFFFTHPVGILILTVVKALALLVPLLVGVAYLTYAERKVLAAMQLRKGPNVVGPFGLFQSTTMKGSSDPSLARLSATSQEPWSASGTRG